MHANPRTSEWDEFGGSYSADGCYRWSFEHDIGRGTKTVCWIGLHPAKGDSTGRPRPTLQQMVNRSLQRGMGRIILVNLYSWRCNDFGEIQAARDQDAKVGRETDHRIERAVERSDLVIAAWGTNGAHGGRGDEVMNRLDAPVHCLGLTGNGQPRQLRGIRSDQKLIWFS